MFIRNKRKIWKEAEDLVKKHFQDQWYRLIKQNFTIRWGEIDLIFEKNDDLIFVEVKMISDIEDFSGYISNKKLKALNKTINYFLYKNLSEYKNIYLKFVFVKNNEIVEIYDLV